MSTVLLQIAKVKTSKIQTSSSVYIASSITCAILKAIHAGVGFGSGTETRSCPVQSRFGKG